MGAIAEQPRGRIELTDEAAAYEFLEQLRWGTEGPKHCPHCSSQKGAWFLKPKNPDGRKSKGGSAARSQRRVWKCRESTCRRQFSVLTNTVMHGTKLPVRSWVEVIDALCSSEVGLSARDVAEHWGMAEKSALTMLERIQHALERPEAAGASLASNAPLWVRVTSVPIETTAQRAAKAKAQARKDRAAKHAAAQVEADVKRALTEALGDGVETAVASAPATPPTNASVAEPAKPSEASPRTNGPRIDQDQVASDVQRVLSELAETEGLFAEGWLDEDASSESLGPSWTDSDGEGNVDA